MIAISYIPKCFRKKIFLAYCQYFDVDQEEIEKPLENFETLQSFFTRQVKKRKINYENEYILAPADSKILSF